MAKTLLRELRERLGWSQEQLAKRIGKSFSSVRGYESGRDLPPEVLRQCESLAKDNGFEDLFKQFDSKLLAIFGARGVPLFKSSRMIDAPTYHALLDEILASGDEVALMAIQAVLQVCAARRSGWKLRGATEGRGGSERTESNGGSEMVGKED